jgi:rhodanese-related sulfurtransferase
MEQLIQYLTHHPLLAGGTAVLAIVVAVFEMRLRGGAASALTPAAAVRVLNDGATVVDLRTPEDFAAGHIIGARNIPSAGLTDALQSLAKYREKPVVVCCDAGNSSAAAMKQLQAQGFTRVTSLRGGIAAWKQENLPLIKETAKSKESKRG